MCGLDRQGSGDRLRRKFQHIAERDILIEDLGKARRRAIAGRVRGIEDAESSKGEPTGLNTAWFDGRKPKRSGQP